MGKFSERYKGLKTAELLLILERPEDYQPEAVADAKTELATRDITDADRELLHEKKEELIEEEIEKRNQAYEQQELLKNYATRFLNFIYPVSQVTQSTHIAIGIILLMGTIGAVETLYHLYQSISYNIRFDMEHGGVAPGFWLYLTLIAIFNLVMPLGIMLMWLRKRAGWIIFTAGLVVDILYYTHQRIIDIELNMMMGEPAFNNWPRVGYFLLFIAYYSLMIILITRPGVREAYKISRGVMSKTVGISMLVFLLLWQVFSRL